VNSECFKPVSHSLPKIPSSERKVRSWGFPKWSTFSRQGYPKGGVGRSPLPTNNELKLARGLATIDYPFSSSNSNGRKIANGKPQKLVKTNITANRIDAIASSSLISLNNPIKLREVIVLRRELMTRLILLGRFW
jgi:hypothetical protein